MSSEIGVEIDMKKILSRSLLAICCLSLIYVGFRLDVNGFFAPPQPCPFCDESKISCQAFMIDDQVMGFVPYKQIVEGHVLIVVKRHVERLEDLTDQEVQSVGRLIRKVHDGEKKMFHENDYLILEKNGCTAGQTVPHVHFHYLPRCPKIGHLQLMLRSFWANVTRPARPEVLYKQAEQWRSELKLIEIERN